MPRLRPYYEVPATEWACLPSSSGRSARKGCTDPREPIRQWLLRELVDSYKLPAEWLGTRILALDARTNTDCPAGFLGLVVNTISGDPFLWVSIEAPGKGDLAEARLRHILESDAYARMGLTTDSQPSTTRCLRRRSDTNKCEYVVDIECYSSFQSLGTCEPYTATSGKPSAKERSLEPLSQRVENVLFEAHSHIRDIDGMHPDEALDELCKVLYVKMYDEEMTPDRNPYRIQKWIYGSTEEMAASVRRLYDDANQYDVRVCSLKLPGYDRSRGVFSTPIRLSSPALAKVAETLQDYSLTRSGIDVKGRAFQKVLGPATRAGMGQYFTPHAIIDFMVQVASPDITELILDPFSGSAHFLTRSLRVVLDKNPKADSKLRNEFAFHKLHGIEKSDRMVRVAMTDMRLHGDGHSNIRCTDALVDFANFPDLRPESFDLILTNPPFGSLLGQEAIAALGTFKLADGRKSVPLEVLGLERCIQFLRPGGRLGIVLPDGVLVNRNARYVREWLESQAKLRAIVSLPIEAFSPYGANIKTSIVFVRKWKKGEAGNSDYKVQLARIDNIGYDAAGRPREGAELELVAQDIRNFLEQEGW